MSSRIDLHLHSLYSDGRQSVRQVFELAKANGVEVLSLTDHDSTHHLAEAQQVADELGLRLIPGIELTTMHEGRVLHILGYNFDPANAALQAALEELLENRKQAVVAEMKIVPGIDLNDFISRQQGFFNRWKATDYLLEKKLAVSREQALGLLAGVRVGSADITIEKAIQLVHNAGGIAVMAHPFGPKISVKVLRDDMLEQDALVKTIAGFGLDGIECYHSSHTKKDTERALNIAHTADLLITGGSDWHGPLSLTGEGIKEYIPDYPNYPGDLDMPLDVQDNLSTDPNIVRFHPVLKVLNDPSNVLS